MKKTISNVLLVISLGLLVCLSGCPSPAGNNGTAISLTGITLDTTDVKKEFTVGDNFSSEGLKVTAVYSDNSIKQIIDFTADGFDSSESTESQTIIITYTENGKTVTATYTVVIKEKAAGDDTPGGEDDPGAGDNPGGEDDPGAGDNPGGEDDPGAGDIPGGEDDPGAGDNPGGEDDPGAGDIPGGEDDPGAGDNPGGEDDPGAEDNPPVTVEFDITYQTEFGSVDSKKVEDGYILTEADLPSLTETGYVFSGWNKKAGDVINSATTITASWTPAADTAYRVEHYQQNIADDDYTIVTADTENKTGTTLTDTAASSKTYTGFTAKTFRQEKIAADGTTVVKVYYDRNSYTFKFDTAGGNTIADITLKYGAAVTVPVNPTKPGYVFENWNAEIPATMPAEDVTFTASWKKIDSAFDITLNPGSTLKMNYTVISDEQIKFEVPAGYDSYMWLVDGDEDSEAKTNEYLITTDVWNEEEYEYVYANGKHEILVIVAAADGSYDSAKATFVIEN